MPRWSIPEVAFWIWSPLMIDGASRYAVLWSVEQVTNGSFGSSLPAKMSSLSQRVAWNCSATICMYWLVLCRSFFSWAMRSARSLRGSVAGASAGGAGGGLAGEVGLGDGAGSCG
ncbi:Uncharacterised protein [Mycobacterium tuberculosis]|uniref:Uncharacterized protein n=1 Tax=Mycobacterium tuberculosis TaxID=1773 RepID=A0A655JR35_MYCTX|nr:Uncharacterised protein [Mycobacterium tuberculosis]CKS72781.1 Uncharacterised protein [Mycobacterium tuberculosis]CKS87969.1 Uncharacterised protein [Mycobacterium tuberculosis]CKT38998.1 Uncharacterised protein [Mycobacterium tuberculosis]CKT60373.1 Uncharacterised protein [Mycobacterium tuberculosis]